MPKHIFSFNHTVVAAVRQHISKAVDSVEPKRYGQEPAYIAALVHSLEGIVYEGPSGKIYFKSVVYSDRARNSAESIFGADVSITAEISDGHSFVRKAILVQSKMGEISKLSLKDKDFLRSQVTKMKKLTKAPKIMQITDMNGKRLIHVVSGNSFLKGVNYRLINLESYFVGRVLTTLDGCTNDVIVSNIQDSKLTQLRVLVDAV